MIFDENNKLIESSLNRKHGSGCYSDRVWKCSKCGKIYCTLGALKYYHEKCEAKLQ